MMRRAWVMALLVTAFGVLVFLLTWPRWRGVPVREEVVTRGDVVEAIYATGRVDSDRKVTVRGRRTAPLEKLLVGVGETVTQGQLLAIQDAREARLELARRQQELNAAQAALLEAQDAAKRAEQLFLAGLLPANEHVKARERAAELASRAEALLRAVQVAEEQLSWYQVRSPQSGVVAQCFRFAGDLVREGDEILSIVDLGESYLRVAVDERDLGKVRAGQEVRIVFDAFPQQILTGQVWRVVPTVDRLTRSADVLVQLPKARPPLQLDMTATVNIVTQVVPDALLVPRLALRGTGMQRQVLQVDASQRLVAVEVKVGPCDLDRCQVLEGLTAGEKVVISPSELSPGAKTRRL
ncbi:MAG: efflux RND transporter periplasmic adaptor subunit [Thermoanaerobaculaceae bacterium]